jgi:hypothetical protein
VLKLGSGLLKGSWKDPDSRLNGPSITITPDIVAFHYKVIKPQEQVVADLGRFLTTEQWFEDSDDPFGRASFPVPARSLLVLSFIVLRMTGPAGLPA